MTTSDEANEAGRQVERRTHRDPFEEKARGNTDRLLSALMHDATKEAAPWLEDQADERWSARQSPAKRAELERMIRANRIPTPTNSPAAPDDQEAN